jgi:hypothetical protein
LPSILLKQAQLTDGALEVRPAAGVAAEPVLLRHVRPHETDPQHYLVDALPYEASFSVRPDNKAPPALVLSKFQATQSTIEFRHAVRLITNRGRLPTLKLHIKDGPVVQYIVDAPGANVIPIKNKATPHPAWVLTFPTGLPEEVYVTVRGSIAGDNVNNLTIPHVEVEGASAAGSWLAWKDVEIAHAATSKRLANQKRIKDLIVAIANEGWSRDIVTWNCAETAPALRLTLPRTPPRSITHVLEFNERARLSDGRWLHDATFWALVPEAAELHVKFPAPVKHFGVFAEGRELAARNLSLHDFVLAIDGSPMPRPMAMRWRYAPGFEHAESPSIAMLRFDQAPMPVPQRLFVLPPGYARTDRESRPMPTLVERLLHQAQLHMDLSAAFAADASPSEESLKRIVMEQQQFFACLRQAEYALAAWRSIALENDENTTFDRLTRLKARNAALAKERRYDEERKAAEKAKKSITALHFDEPGVTGTPMLVPLEVTNFVLESARTRLAIERRRASEWILLGALFFLVLSYFRRGLTIVRWFAPELAIAVCIVGICVFGPSLFGALLIALLILVRVWWIARTAHARWLAPAIGPQARRAPSTQTKPPAAGQASTQSLPPTPPA